MNVLLKSKNLKMYLKKDKGLVYNKEDFHTFKKVAVIFFYSKIFM